MEIAMKPFIMIYHMVRAFFLLPKTILEYAYTGVVASIDKITHREEKMKKEETEEDRALTAEELHLIKQETNKIKRDLGKKTTFNYTVKSGTGGMIKSSFDAYNQKEVETYLLGEGYEIVKIEPRKPYDIELFTHGQMKTSDLSFMLTQLSTYIKAGIPLIDSVRILAKQTVKPAKRKVYDKLIYDLLMGENFSTALENQEEKFPKLLINMVKTAEMTGDLPTTLDDMSDYYTSMDQTKRQMISAMTYPTIIFVIAIGVIFFILAFVIPKFVEMFENNGADIPMITRFVIASSKFVQHNWYIVVIVAAALISGTVYLYKNVPAARRKMQVFLMHIPIVKNVIIYNEVANFTKTFASLLNHNVFITDSMEILVKVTNNEVYKKIINNTLRNLSKGAKISEAFQGQWAFPVVAYEMLVTGENTGQLGLMMEKVAEHYQVLHKNVVDQLKSLIEPLMICFLAVIVGGIVLSIVVPMFSIYGQIQ